MRKKIHFLPDSLPAKIILAFLISVIPLFMAQSAIMKWGSRQVQTEIYNSAYANVIYLRDHFEENINMVRTNLQLVLDAKAVRQLFVYYDGMTRGEFYESASEVSGLLDIMRNSNPFVKEIRLYYPRQGLAFQCAAMRKGLYYPQNEKMEALVGAFRAANSGVIEDEDGIKVCAVSGTGYSGAADSSALPAFYIEAILSREKIEEHLSTFNILEDKFSLQYNHAARSFVFNRASALTDAEETALACLIEPREENVYSEQITLGGKEMLLIGSYCSALRSTFAQLIELKYLQGIPNAFRAFIGVFALLTGTVLAFLALFVNRSVTKPNRLLLDAFEATGEGRFDTRVDEKRYALEYRSLARHFNNMNRHIEALIAENYESTISLQRAQLKQLQAQINPHFLFNSFFLLKSMVEAGEREQCESFLECLGNYFQYISSNDNDTARLVEEFEHANNYLAIQLLRFEGSLEAQIDSLPEHWKDVTTLRLSLQPIVENVMVHGKWREGDIRHIRMYFCEDENGYAVHVEDNGREITEKEILELQRKLNAKLPLSATSGLNNIHRRFLLHYGGGGVTVYQSEWGGFGVALTIPKEEAKHV